jgi:PatG C-terminal
MSENQSGNHAGPSENLQLNVSEMPSNKSEANEVRLQDTADKGCGCGAINNKEMSGNHSYVYAIGRIKPRFPNPSIEKELAQVLGREDTKTLSDFEALHSVLSKKENRYLVRRMCWVLTIEGLETYLVVPHDPSDYDLIIESLRPTPRTTDVDVVIGLKGPIADPQMCNGLMIPIVMLDQMYSFDVGSLIKEVPRPENIPAKQFSSTVEEVFSRISQMADNAGATDEHRALNYLSVRYQAIYSHTAAMFSRDYSLTAIEVQPSTLSGARKILEVVLTYTNRKTDVDDRYFIRVDVTNEFPFLVTKLSPYYLH